jgi:hypothetical protein
MPDASLLLQQAADARAQARNARGKARESTSEHDVAALTALADELEQRARELQQQAGELGRGRARARDSTLGARCRRRECLQGEGTRLRRRALER